MVQEYIPPGTTLEEAEKIPEKAPSLLGHLHSRGANSDIKVVKPSARREVGAIPQKVLDEILSSKVQGHTHGVPTRSQCFLDQLEETRFGQIGLQAPPAIACQKGQKDRINEPNQDNYSVTHFVNGFTLACVLKLGHTASMRAVQAVPYFLYTEGGFDHDFVDETHVEQALIRAFESANADVIAVMGRKGMCVRASGTTLVAAL